mmetsp:Transcript_21763/g.19831  ORF Transcript_21763/g.19831 Transcript_21763/m.19831 type:complete len:520 (+) Transcript_21763:44-1603(+)
MYSSISFSLLLYIIKLVYSNENKLPTKNLFFYETFDEIDPFESGKWFKSLDPKYTDQPVVIRPPANPIKGFESDKGVALNDSHRHYAFGAKFPTVLDTKGKDLVIQYELRFDEVITCSGAYIKLPRYTDSLDLNYVNNETPYSLMFGPDRCGSNSNKAHFIIQHQNPNKQTWEEKHFNQTAAIKTDKKSHLYTLHIRNADNSFDLYVDKKITKGGNLLKNMNPPINPPSEIDDPTDFKPEDWVEEERIVDPDARKPDDWDEDAPRQIPDPNAVKPEGWLDDAQLVIPNPNATRPEDWVDEEDGIWEAPTIPNPACEAAGCGKWEPPLIKNPAYKGKWIAPKIKNPAYKGKWVPRKIPNPDYYFDPNPANIAPMAGVVVEVWITNPGIIFDNFVIAHSLDDAFEFANATFALKSEAELNEEKAKKEKVTKKKDKNNDKKKNANKKNKKESTNTKENLIELYDNIKKNPWSLIVTILSVILAIVVLLPKKAKKVITNETLNVSETPVKSSEQTTSTVDKTK